MLALAALLLTVDAPPPPPAAAPPPVQAAPLVALRILVVPRVGEDPARVEEVYSGLRAAGLLPVELEERAGVDRPAPTEEAQARRDDARARLEEARARFRDVDLDGTRAAADAAVDEVLRLDRPEDGVDVLIDALLLKAEVALQAGIDDDARAALTLVARLDPSLAELHPGLYPPSLCEAYAAARAAEAKAPPASLVVRPRVAAFASAEVLVDGRPPTATLRAGPHLVSARARGDVTAARIVVLDEQEPATFEPFLAPAGAAARRRALVARAAAAVDEPARAQALARLGALCAARAVLYVGGPEAALWSPHGLAPLALSSSAPGLALGRATLAALQAPSPAVAPPASLDPAVVVAAGGVGLAVVAGAVAAGLWALWPAHPPKRPPRAVDVTCCIDF